MAKFSLGTKLETLNLPVQQHPMSKYMMFVLCLTALLAFSSCKSKKKSLSGDEPVEVSDFIDFFPEIKGAVNFSDTSVVRKDNDSLLISYPVFTQFVPDTAVAAIFGKNVKPKLYPLAKVKGDETYLFVKGNAAGRKTIFVAAFDKKDKFIAAMPVIGSNRRSGTQYTASMDTRYNIYKNIARKNTDGSVSEGREVFVLNTGAGKFMLIMADAVGEEEGEVINPIDTLTRKQKFTGDYGSAKTSLFSFRDARREDRLNFFIHFEKNNGECTGELKGEAIMRGANKAEYRVAGDPCALQFTFSGNAVTVKEIAACGNRRGLRCLFDGVYTKRKEAKTSTKTDKK